MTTHLTKIWWDVNSHTLVKRVTPEAEIYEREWVGLTDEEIAKLADDFLAYQIEDYQVSGVFTFAKAIEAKLREKNT